MNVMQQLLTDHIDIWTGAEIERKSGRGRAASNAGSVYGIKKLRELILELAVRGKLVPQDTSDEPASELLTRIRAEKARLVAEGKIKKDKPLAAITEEEKPFELPQSWNWVRLGQVAEANTGYAFKSAEYTNEGTFVLRVTNINPDSSLDLSDAKYIDPDVANSVYRNFLLSDGDILLVMVGGSLGKLGVVEKNCLPAVLNQNMWKMTRFGDIEKQFFMFGLRQINTSQIEITNSTHGHLAQGEYLSKLFPLPPIEEQHRIVTKVDELMALCDQLETRHSKAADAHEKLVSHLLGTLTQSQNAQDFSANWQRIAAHFDTLFTTESSIDALKKTLLQMAVMGKLVPQDAKEEPASELLKRIQAEKSRLIAEGKSKKDKPLALITEDEKSFSSPKGWNWVRLNELLIKIGAGSTPLGGKQVYVNAGVPFLRSQNVWDQGLRLDDVAFIESETHQKMSGTHVFAGDLLFNITGASIGRCAIVPNNFEIGNVSQHVTIIRPASKEISRFLHLVLTSKHVQQTVMDVQVGVSREGLSIGKLGQFVIPIPPLSEQHRIITKVDELIALCDQLKSRITDASQLQKKLADVLVEQAVA